MTNTFKMAEALKQQVQSIGTLKHAWFTSFNLNVDFFERHVLSALLGMDAPRSRIDFELIQQKLNGHVKEGRRGGVHVESQVDVKVFADQRMYDASDLKRTAIEIYGVNPQLLDTSKKSPLDKSTLFHPKVIFLQAEDGTAILGAGSANLTLSGWSTNQEVFTFNKIECQHQAEAVKAFFKPLFAAQQIKHRFKFADKLRQEEEPSDWRFSHTLQHLSRGQLNPMLGELLLNSGDTRPSADKEQTNLVVWSPYFPADLAGFIERLGQLSDERPLRLHVIPDMVENQRMRTQWTSKLQQLIEQGDVRFHRNPIPKDERSDLCHAKVWMTDSKIAIGSWNFTTPGSNIIFSDNKSGHLNIEAGVILENPQPIATIIEDPLVITQDNFMQTGELEQHALEVVELLPLDMLVEFDWQTLTYHVSITKLDDELSWQSLALHLPDVKEPLRFDFAHDQACCVLEHTLDNEPETLLVNHAYHLAWGLGQRYLGFIIERNSMMRRVEQFESLDEIFNSLIDGRELASNPNASLRGEILGNDTDWLDEQDAGSLSEKPSSPALSYFRMFQAMDAFEQRVQQLKSDQMLEQYAFVVPGCLVEMSEKIRHELIENANVFNWYMKQEFNLLIETVAKKASNGQLKVRLRELRFKSSDSVIRSKGLQSRIGDSEYRKVIKEKCGYVSI